MKEASITLCHVWLKMCHDTLRFMVFLVISSLPHIHTQHIITHLLWSLEVLPQVWTCNNKDPSDLCAPGGIISTCYDSNVESEGAKPYNLNCTKSNILEIIVYKWQVELGSQLKPIWASELRYMRSYINSHSTIKKRFSQFLFQSSNGEYVKTRAWKRELMWHKTN